MKITSYKKVDGLLQPGKVYNIYTSQGNKKSFDSNAAFPGQSHHLRYDGKKGIHHFFTSVLGGFSLTQTSIQLLGKFIEECK